MFKMPSSGLMFKATPKCNQPNQLRKMQAKKKKRCRQRRTKNFLINLFNGITNIYIHTSKTMLEWETTNF